MCKKSVYLISAILTLHLAFSDISMGADPNLVGWWKFDEGSGTAAIDSSGSGRNGTINGNPTWGVSSPYDESRYLLFDGTNDYVDVNYISQGAFLLQLYTVSAWFRADGGSGRRDIISATGSAQGHGLLLELFDAPVGSLRYIHRAPLGTGGLGDPERIITSTTYNDGQWHHVAVVRASDTSRLVYVDGEQVGSKTDATTAFDAPVRVFVGALRPSDLSRFWNGGIDDVRIYDRPLSSAEITQLAGSPLASNPRPGDGEKDVSVSPLLSWKPGVGAGTHNIYFGANSSDVNSATMTTHPNVTVASLNVGSYKPGTLQFNTAYYWRVDEVKGAAIWRGDVWNFTTGSYFIVDDLESYGAADTPGPPPPAGGRIWYTWKDGEGWTEPSIVQGNGTGSVVDASASTVHGGNQSLVFNYDNDGTNLFDHSGKKYYSEIKADTSYLAIGRDWTKAGVKALTLWFYGDSNNDANATEQMYVQLNGAKVLYDGNMSDISEPSWHEWNIDLSKFGINLSNVTEIAIGFGDQTNTTPGGSGVVYFDDIRLYQPRCLLSRRTADFAELDYAPQGFPVSGDCVIDYRELNMMASDWLVEDYVIKPTTNPALVGGLAAYYSLDEGTGTTTADASGNGHSGTLGAGVTWVTPGLAGISAIDVSGARGARVSIGNWDPSAGTGQLTVSIWVKWSGLRHGFSQGLICKRDGWDDAGVRFMFEMDTPGNNGGLALRQFSAANTDLNSAQGIMTPYIGQWAHAAAAFDGTTARIYLNGREIASGPFTFASGTGAGLVIGNTNSESGWPDCPEAFNGDLDEARIYNRALSPAEIAYLADTTPNDGQLHVPVPSPAELYDAEAEGSQKIDLKDFAILADNWLTEQMWP